MKSALFGDPSHSLGRRGPDHVFLVAALDPAELLHSPGVAYPPKRYGGLPPDCGLVVHEVL